MTLTTRSRAALAAAALIITSAAPAFAARTASLADEPAPPVPPDPVVLPKDPTTGPCAYTPTPEDPYVVFKGLPADPNPTPNTGYRKAVMVTNWGPIEVLVDRAAAPCTTQSFLHLAAANLFSNTICHRLTTYPRLSVLQCGDPLGHGWGGPGYSFKDELPTNLKPWQGDATSPRRTYPRGTLAMANAGPNTNGSQFFLVFADSGLRPDYTVFGCVSEQGMRTLDFIAKGGVKRTAESALDGPPERDVTVRDVSVMGESETGCPSS